MYIRRWPLFNENDRALYRLRRRYTPNTTALVLFEKYARSPRNPVEYNVDNSGTGR